MAEHRPPLSSPGRLTLDRLGAAQLEALLLIGVATAGRYLQCYEKSAIHGGNIKKCFMEIDILQLFECANKKIFIVCEVAKDE